MGSDGEITNDGFVRTDTMIVLSINRTTGTVAMLSLPRDLFVKFSRAFGNVSTPRCCR